MWGSNVGKRKGDKRTESKGKSRIGEIRKVEKITEEGVMKNKVLSQSQEFYESHYLHVCIITLSKHRALC